MICMQINLKKELITALRHPLSYSSFLKLMKLLINAGFDRKYIIRTILISFLSFCTIPLRMFENFKYSKQVENVLIQHPPIFIIGHWRSGTTYIHQLMVQDENFGYLSTLQVWAPEMFLTLSQPFFLEKINRLVPSKRIMDNVKVSIHSPQEGNWAIVKMFPYAIYPGNCFLKKVASLNFNNSIQFEIESVKNAWIKTYMKILKKATFKFKGKRLLLKNPAHTEKIKILLEMFPDAKFVHIYRNPYKVYASSKHSFISRASELKLQDINEKATDEYILKRYQRVMQTFFIEKTLIPQDNFFEIRYEDFVGNELTVVRKIYEQFKLPDFDKAVVKMKSYLDSCSNYKNNTYSLNDETISKVYDAWKFTIDKWQYSPPN